MEKQEFNVVCQNCHTPQLKSFSDSWFKSIVLSFGLLAALIMLLLFAGGLGLILWLVLVFIYLPMQRKHCPRCGTFKLLPINSPRALAIMKEHGWHED